MEVIQNISRDRVVDFYEKWYRPDLMSVIVVGDINTKDVENAIINTMGDIPAATDPLEMPDNSFSKENSVASTNELRFSKSLTKFSGWGYTEPV